MFEEKQRGWSGGLRGQGGDSTERPEGVEQCGPLRLTRVTAGVRRGILEDAELVWFLQNKGAVES